MKRNFIALLALIALLMLISCGKPDTPQNLDLTGEWVQTNSTSNTSYHIAVIADGAIEVYWKYYDDQTTSLYWAGTYIAPDSALDEYSWESVNDKNKTKTAMLASTGDKKAFTYENGILSYSVSAFGTTETVEMEHSRDTQ